MRIDAHLTGPALALIGMLTVPFTHIQTQAQAPPSAAGDATIDPWFRASAKPKDFAPARLPWNIFTIELPKNWVMAPGYSSVLLLVTEKPKGNLSAASIVLEQMRLAAPQTEADIDAGLAELEGNLARGRDPGGQGFEHQVKTVNNRRFVFVTYTRPGLNGTDRVVQYAFPNGNVMYRLLCIAPDALVAAKYQATFAHVAASFTPSPRSAN